MCSIFREGNFENCSFSLQILPVSNFFSYTFFWLSVIVRVNEFVEFEFRDTGFCASDVYNFYVNLRLNIGLAD